MASRCFLSSAAWDSASRTSSRRPLDRPDDDVIAIFCSLPVPEILRGHVNDAVRVDVESHLDLRDAAGRGGNAVEVEAAERLVVARQFALSLEHVDFDAGLAVRGGREDLRFTGRDRRIADDQARRHAAVSLNAKRQRCEVQQEQVLDVTRQHAGLHARADRHHFVRIDALVGPDRRRT